MRKLIGGSLAACLLVACAIPEEAWAIPGNGAAISDGVESSTTVEQARVYCYNRYSGRFLHWGSCGGGYGGYRPHPRVYCYNRYTGRFKHWGHC